MRGNDIKMVVTEIGRGGMDWTDLAQDTYQRWALVNVLRAPANVGNFWSS